MSSDSIRPIPVILDCHDSFRVQAAYTFVMLGLVCGFIPDFIPNNESGSAGIVYAEHPHVETNGVYLPVSLNAQQFLTKKNIYPSDQALKSADFATEHLSLFPMNHAEPPVNAGTASIHSDIISAAFFFLSLHEEWSCAERDQFRRFQAKYSLLGKLDMLHVPVVAQYAELLVAMLRATGLPHPSTARFAGKNSAICLTHDIDYLSKFSPGIAYREIAKYFLMNHLNKSVAERFTRLKEYLSFRNPALDPYKVSFLKILALERELGIRSTFFLKAGGKDPRDMSYRLDDPWLLPVMETIAREGHETGLHPSFRTVDDEPMFLREKHGLDTLLGDRAASMRRLDSRTVPELTERCGNDDRSATATSVRMHYLRFRYPSTWRMQSDAGFGLDSTLGFAEHEGFRNGACHPFLCYDHDTKSVLPLWEMPLIAMDGTLSDYRGMDPSQALEALLNLIGIVRNARGCGAILFHNICFDAHDFPGWDQVFTATASHLAQDPEVLCSTLTDTFGAWLRSGGYSATNDIVKKIGNFASRS